MAIRSLDSIESRVESLEHRQNEANRKLLVLEEKIDINSSTIASIKTDTGQIVALFRASKFGVAIVKWMATVGGAILVAWAAIRGHSPN